MRRVGELVAPGGEHRTKVDQRRVGHAQTAHGPDRVALPEPDERGAHRVAPFAEVLQSGRTLRPTGDVVGAQNGERRRDDLASHLRGVDDRVVIVLPELRPLASRVKLADHGPSDEVALDDEVVAGGGDERPVCAETIFDCPRIRSST